MKKYHSIEEFYAERKKENFLGKCLWDIRFGKRGPIIWRQIWDDYFSALSDAEKKIALQNKEYADKLSYDHKHHEGVNMAITQSTGRLANKLKGYNFIEQVSSGLYHGGLELEVYIKGDTDFSRAREVVPNYFEGWYVRLHQWGKNSIRPKKE